MIFKTRRAAVRERRKHEQVVPVVSQWQACELGCACVRRPSPKRIGWALVLGLVLIGLSGCASVPASPESIALNKKLRHREGTIDRFCLDQEKLSRLEAIRDCQYYASRARHTLRRKVYSQPALAQEAVRTCGLPKVVISARATANHNKAVNLCYHRVFSTLGGK